MPNARGACLLPATNRNADSIASSALTKFVPGKAKSRPVSPVTLALATANLNSRICRGGLLDSEVWTQRDQITAEQLPVTDRQLILNQYSSRACNHAHSAKGNAHGHNSLPAISISVGDLVYVKGDRDKCRACLQKRWRTDYRVRRWNYGRRKYVGGEAGLQRPHRHYNRGYKASDDQQCFAFHSGDTIRKISGN